MPGAKFISHDVDTYKLTINDGGSVSFVAGDGLTPATTGTFNFFGNLNVVGSTTTIETSELSITDKTITVNKDETGAGVSTGPDGTNTAGLIIERGSYPDAKLLYDEDLDWYDSRLGGTTSITGAFAFKDNNNETIGIFTNFVGTFDQDLVLLGEGTKTVSVTGTTSYERQVFTYQGDVIEPNVNNLDRLSDPIDPDIIPNVQALKDYVRAYNTYNFTDTIESADTTVSVADSEETSSPSLALVTVDGTEVARFYQASIDLLQLKIDSDTLTSLDINGNVKIGGNGTGSVEFTTDALFPVTATDPTAPTDGVKLYGKAEGDGGTGLFFVNQSETQDELISRNKALLYSIIF
jgi:hypothetical protein